MEAINSTSLVNPLNMYNNLNTFILNPIVLIIILLVIVAYFVLFSTISGSSNSGLNNSGLNNSDLNNSDSNGNSNILVIIVAIIIVFLIVNSAFQYFYGINIITYVTTYITNLFSQNKPLNIIVDESTFKPLDTVLNFNKTKQVFNIPGNYYNYNDATALCKAYGGKLATYKQVENAYKNGGEWCNYGWSDEQMALFPTQQNTYDKLQSKTGHEHDCGRPGINGGYIANPNVQFGVNCYGHKPKITEEEEELMKTITPYPETKEEQDFQLRVEQWKNKINSILLSPFNYTSWQEI